jgi:hypothetical protein
MYGAALVRKTRPLGIFALSAIILFAILLTGCGTTPPTVVLDEHSYYKIEATYNDADNGGTVTLMDKDEIESFAARFYDQPVEKYTIQINPTSKELFDIKLYYKGGLFNWFSRTQSFNMTSHETLVTGSTKYYALVRKSGITSYRCDSDAETYNYLLEIYNLHLEI